MSRFGLGTMELPTLTTKRWEAPCNFLGHRESLCDPRPLQVSASSVVEVGGCAVAFIDEGLLYRVGENPVRDTVEERCTLYILVDAPLAHVCPGRHLVASLQHISHPITTCWLDLSLAYTAFLPCMLLIPWTLE